MRYLNRSNESLREIKIHTNFTAFAEGSVLVEFGRTQVICTASLEAQVPPFLKGSGKGWVTAEYGMLPRSTHTRMRRDRTISSGRTQEIQRLIGRSLRAVTNLNLLGEKQVVVDCDVIQADGGTRTASITGGFVALALCFKRLKDNNIILNFPLTDYVAAVSAGLVAGKPMLDLDYSEDSTAEVDMNFVMTGAGQFVEIQGTAESKPFDEKQLAELTAISKAGIHNLFKMQREAIGSFFNKEFF